MLPGGGLKGKGRIMREFIAASLADARLGLLILVLAALLAQ